MPFYELLCISAHNADYRVVKQLVETAAKHVMDNGGVVRSIDSWGTRTLPQIMRRQKQVHHVGDYWTLHFDTHPKTVKSLSAILKRDPRVIRWTTLKMGDKIEDIIAPRGKTTGFLRYSFGQGLSSTSVKV